jgi:thiol:disulfide interchange protein DsbD
LKRYLLSGGLAVLLGWGLTVVPAAGSQEDPVVSVQTAWSADGFRPGLRLHLAVIFDIRRGFHINADAAQLLPMEDIRLIPTQVRVKGKSAGVSIEAIRFPPAHGVAVDFSPRPLMVFSNRAIVYLTVVPDPDISAPSIRLTLETVYQACDAQVCRFPEKTVIDAALGRGAAGRPSVSMHPEVFEGLAPDLPEPFGGVDFDLFGWRFSFNPHSLWGFSLLLLTASLGGMLLNFTPCVLPLLPIKLISLSNAAENPSRCLALGFSTFGGIIAFWMVLGAVIALIAGFTATNQLFQYPVFTLAIGLIIAGMALGMFDVFALKLPGFLYRIHPSQETLKGSFVLGVLAAVLSTPCTAPFMGAAAAWAVTRDPVTVLSVFAAIGTGMALPYLALSAFPDRVARIPRSGPASIVVKQTMGLFMLAAAAYFIGSGVSALMATPPDPPPRFYWWGVTGLAAAGGLWMAYRTWRITANQLSRSLFAGLGGLIFLASVWGGLHLTDRGPIDWIYYTPQRFETAVADRKVVVMVFTAEWCLNCKALEQGVLRSEPVADMLAGDDVVPVKVDITGNNPAGKAKLKATGQLTIPLLIVYDRSGREIFRSDFYTADQIAAAVAAAREAD